MIVQGVRRVSRVLLDFYSGFLRDFKAIARLRGERSYSLMIRRLYYHFLRCFF